GDVAVFFSEVVVSDDIGGVYWIADLDTGFVTVFPGYMEEPHNLVATSGLDGMVPLAWDAPYGPIPPTVPFTIEILTDNFPGETSWDLVHLDADTVVGSITTGELADQGTLYTWDFDLASGGYMFTIYDTFGDGICCAYGAGYYSLILDGNEIATGGEFGAEESVTFNTSDGRYNIVQYNYLVHFSDEKENNGYIVREDFSVSLPIFIEQGQFESPYDNIEIAESRNMERDVPVNAYNVYRTIDGVSYDLITTVGSDVLTYTDEDVVNGTTYYYYVTADYSPDGTESGPSNVAEAIPVEWIELALSSGTALSGTTDTLDIFVNNESDVSVFHFIIQDTPDLIEIIDVLRTDRTISYQSLTYNELDGNMEISGSAGTLGPGSGAVCRVVVEAASQDPAILDLAFLPSSSVQDANSNEMIWTATGATFEVTVETQHLLMPNAYAEPNEMVTIPLVISNSQDVYGIQIFLVDDLNYLSGIAVQSTNYHDFSDWTVEGNTVGNEYRILMFNNSMNNPLSAGTGHIADIYLYIDAGAATGSTVQIFMEEVFVVDVNNIAMHAELYESEVYIGTPAAIYTIGDVDQSAQTFTIELENTEPVYVAQLDLGDSPDGIEIIDVSAIGRFNGIIEPTELGGSYETEDGNALITAYDPSLISTGSGEILEVSYDVKSNTGFSGDVISWIMDVSSGDAGWLSIPSSGTGFAILDANLSVVEEIEIPVKFALHPAYPNPFNPMTNIRYDLPQASYVDLRIFDLTGREVRTLARGFDLAGTKTVVWDAKDNQGQNVSAGVYVYRLEAAGFVQSQKLIYLK
ncbi:MAG: FlgD immunoglobulin-like domain containing protein, partial [Candidatus Marinimicrobia bacterium]|nr:FlgD immunoglobulin-like domain containing protein [Candidatus Neomarinimicrobiota bacterium]